jgi:hypothetical protein
MMLQTLAAYLIVAVAAGFVAWRLFLPTGWKARLRALVRRTPAPPQDGCGCARDPL